MRPLSSTVLVLAGRKGYMPQTYLFVGVRSLGFSGFRPPLRLVTGREDELRARPVAPGTRVLPTRSNPNRLFAAERGRAVFVGNT